MKILAVETSCDETAAAVTDGLDVLSSVKVTQEVHAQWGGVVPSLAKRDHEKNIDWVIDQAMSKANCLLSDIGAIAVTQGPGLAIALEVGIKKAKELAHTYNLPLIPVNHVEGHVLSSLVGGNVDISFPAVAMVISGGHTQIIEVERVGKYKILAESLDDDIGEAIDKGARILGLAYPGGPALELLATKGDTKKYPLPLPMARRESDKFSYAGLKSAFFRLVDKIVKENPDGKLNEKQKEDLAAGYQYRVFQHLLRISTQVISKEQETKAIKNLLVGGGVAANKTLRGSINEMAGELGMTVSYPESMVMCTDNAAMIGIVAGFLAEQNRIFKDEKIDEIERLPRWRVDQLQQKSL